MKIIPHNPNYKKKTVLVSNKTVLVFVTQIVHTIRRTMNIGFSKATLVNNAIPSQKGAAFALSGRLNP